MARRRLLTITTSALAAAALAVFGAPAQAAVGDVVTITGTVTNDAGQPVAGSIVYFSSFPIGFASAFTDENGAYTINYTLQADVEQGYLQGPAQAVCDPIGPLTGTAVITANCVVPTFYHLTVSGTATTDNGKPFGVSRFVNASDPLGLAFGSTQLADDGTYSLDVTFREGVEQIDITAPDGTVVATLTGFADGDVYAGVDFTYHPVAEYVPVPVTVHGTVKDKRGRPVAGAEIAYGFGGINDTAFATTAADGTYTIVGETWWNEETLDGGDAFITVDGVRVAFLENLAPDADYQVDYRIGRTRVFEPYLSDIDQYGDGSTLVDVERKVDANGTVSWAFCTTDACQGVVFGSRRTDFIGVSAPDAFGIAFLLFRDTSGAQAQWLRVDPAQIYLSQATFGPKRLDGYDWFDFQGDGPSDFVAWADADGQTTVWTWAAYDGSEEVTSQVVPGRFVSAEHLNLDSAGGDELVLTTKRGNKYTVTLLPSLSEEPVTVATGRGKPTVTYEDTDGDLVLEVVVTFP